MAPVGRGSRGGRFQPWPWMCSRIHQPHVEGLQRRPRTLGSGGSLCLGSSQAGHPIEVWGDTKILWVWSASAPETGWDLDLFRWNTGARGTDQGVLKGGNYKEGALADTSECHLPQCKSPCASALGACTLEHAVELEKPQQRVTECMGQFSVGSQPGQGRPSLLEQNWDRELLILCVWRGQEEAMAAQRADSWRKNPPGWFKQEESLPREAAQGL